MKKILIAFLTICLAMTLFTACETEFIPQNAKELWTKIDETMDSLDAYESNGTAKLSIKISNVQCVMDMTMKNIVSGAHGGDYYEYSFTDSTFKMSDPASGISENDLMKEKNIEAFHDGKMFISLETDERMQKVYSSLTKEEYIAFKESKATETLDIDFNDCINAIFTRNEDGTWSLKYSGYTKRTIDKMMETLGMDDMDFDFDVEDIELDILADGDFRVKEMKFKFIFDEKNAETTNPSFEFSTQYSNYNAVTKITDTLDPGQYTEIEDCRLMYDFEEMLKALEEKKEGSFSLNLEQTLSIPSLNQSQVYSENDTVTYGEKNGSYFYDVTATTGLETVLISYANGSQSLTSAGQTQTLPQTEEAAKEFIRGLINSVKYSPDYVSLITKKADGVYEIQCYRPDATSYEMIFEAYAGELIGILQTITITVENGNIVKIENHTVAKGTASTGYQTLEMKIEVISTNTFNQ